MTSQPVFAVVVSLLAFLSATAAEHPRVQPGKDFSNPMFTMKAPDSSGWVGLSQNASRIAFARSGASPADSDVAVVTLFPIPTTGGAEDFLELIKKGVERDAPKPRFDVESAVLEPSSDRPYTCAKYIATSIDHGEKASPVPKRPLHLQILSLYCRHPEKPGLGFAITFSHRGETQMASFEKEAEAFIAGVQLAPTEKNQ